MTDWLSKYQRTISKGNQNTYKFALGKAVLDAITLFKLQTVPYEFIAESFAQTYFNNAIRFKLKETSNPQQIPSTVQIIQAFLGSSYEQATPIRRLSKPDLRAIGSLLLKKHNRHYPFYEYVLPCFQGAGKDDNGYYLYPKTGQNDFFLMILRK